MEGIDPFSSNDKELGAFLSRNKYDIDSREALRDEGSARRYWRLHSGDGRTAIFCLDHPFQRESSDFVQLTEYLAAKKAAVPRLIDLDERGWFLIEDAGADSLEALYHRNPDAGTMAYEASIQEIARWHALPAPAQVANRYFDFEKLWWEIQFLFERLDRLSVEIGADLRPPFELNVFLRNVCEHLGKAAPPVLTHRDFHARNIFIPDPSDPRTVVFIDFQDARMGLPWYDVSSLLYDPYNSLSIEQRREWLEFYRGLTGRARGEDGNRYYLQALQRIFKALGSYIYLTFEKKKQSYLECIEPALLRLEEIVMLGHFPDVVFLFVKDLRTVHISSVREYAQRMLAR